VHLVAFHFFAPLLFGAERFERSSAMTFEAIEAPSRELARHARTAFAVPCVVERGRAYTLSRGQDRTPDVAVDECDPRAATGLQRGVHRRCGVGFPRTIESIPRKARCRGCDRNRTRGGL